MTRHEKFPAASKVPCAAIPVPGEARAPAQLCLSCDGESTVEIFPLDAVRPYVAICEDCSGTGYALKPYCEICEQTLACDGYCYSCQEYPEGLEPIGWERAERSAFGMPGVSR